VGQTHKGSQVITPAPRMKAGGVGNRRGFVPRHKISRLRLGLPRVGRLRRSSHLAGPVSDVPPWLRSTPQVFSSPRRAPRRQIVPSPTVAWVRASGMWRLHLEGVDPVSGVQNRGRRPSRPAYGGRRPEPTGGGRAGQGQCDRYQHVPRRKHAVSRSSAIVGWGSPHRACPANRQPGRRGEPRPTKHLLYPAADRHG
jgi:hypothetical protein